MRLVLVLLAALFALSLARTAHADPRPDSSWATPALRVALLDGWHSQQKDARIPTSAEPTDNEKSTQDADPGAALTQAVAQMWSQVRAYRRPGGAEVILFGKF